MEQDIQPQQPTPQTPLGKENKVKLFSNFLKKHKIISIIFGLFLVFVFSVLFYFLVVLSIKISEINNNNYNITAPISAEKLSKLSLKDVSLVGQVVEYMEKLSAFRVVLLDPKTYKVIVENDKQRQAIIYFGKTIKNNNEAELFDLSGKITTISHFDLGGIAAGKFVIKIIGKKEPNEGDYTIVYAQKIYQTPWLGQLVRYGVSINYPSKWEPFSGFSRINEINNNEPTGYIEPPIITKTGSGGAIEFEIKGGFFSVIPIISSYKDNIINTANGVTGFPDPGNAYSHGYGLNPTFKETKIDGQDAVLIIPSNDQGEGNITSPKYPKGRQAVVIRYPVSLNVEQPCYGWDCLPGKTTYTATYDYVLIEADKDNFQAILNSIEFIQ